MKKTYFSLLFLMWSMTFFAQDYFPKNDGVIAKNTNYTAFTNAKIYVTADQIIDNGTLLIKDGKVISTGASIVIPKNTTVVNLNGKSIYPSFIDMYSNFGIEKPKSASGSRRSPQFNASRTGYYWNDHIMPEQNGIDRFNYDSKKAIELRKAGFGVVNTHIQNGIVRGNGVLVSLNSSGGNETRILDQNSGQYLSFRKSVTSKQSYPTSLMGSMALLRQMYIDADWYAKGNTKTTDLALEALNNTKQGVKIFDAGNRANVVRADKVGDAAGIQYIILGGGDEYERINEIKATNASLILPLNFPKAYDVENAFLTSSLAISDMRAWNQAPSNPKVLAENNVKFAFTTHKLKSISEFKTNVMQALKHGLSKEKALAALTTIPAELLGKSDMIGSLKNGNLANFLITSGDVFDSKTTLYENWIKGQQNIIEDMNVKDIRGDYNFKLAGKNYAMTISGKLNKLKSEIKTKSDTYGSKISYLNDWINVSFTTQDSTKQEFVRIVANVKQNRNLIGKTIMPNGNELSFYAKAADKKSDAADKKKDTESKELKVMPITYPNNGYGFAELPKSETLLFKNATVWTNENEGILKRTDVLVKNGKIVKIGSNLSDTSATEIDATGKHLTSGIVDEHTHIGITGGGNEAGHNSSAEVTLEDVVDPENIGIYRNLAGGVTSMQILHGSSNPIGGRSAIVKLKWGESADQMIYNDMPKFIKFALGENVKQSNWESRERFPQTRMGVEQLYMDYFNRAKAYDALKKSGKPYRKDYEMETLAEILNKERFISCHSYVQSEINMLMKVAEKFDFNINTFTHILEGYKVADKMKAHGVGGSTFSDWWAYKYEVNDAIPYNAAIMHNAGVVVAINSDDGEMSRRLNQEAAKSVKYGGVSEEDAWKFVTLNPAKLLHIDHRVGSIKVGKDADLVLWSDHPLSVYAKAERTIIEGVTYFDIKRDEILRTNIKNEKSELINMMMQAKNKGLKTQPIKVKENEDIHCDTVAFEH
ncbi:amidohydrolase [Flavobacteriales bacterium 34_180_T64]|mgnify:CR=1 FL=1|nr:amidohydrolase [Flavobacteriales bacterium 34_180_T64]